MTDLPQLTQALLRTRRAGGHRVLYRFTLNAGGRTHELDSVLAAEGEPPWTLLIALIGPHHWAHTYDITISPSGALRANAFLAADYRRLLDALNIGGSGTRPWPASLLLEAADHGARKARPRTWIPPNELPKAARTNIEEEDKIYFFGWFDHVAHPKTGNVTRDNLTKTRRLLGKDAAEYCATHNISTRWTTADNAKHYDHRPLPPGWDDPH